MLRSSIALLFLLAVVACSDAPTALSDAEPPIRVSLHGEGGHSVTGSGHTTNADGSERIFSFAAVQHRDGRTSGSFQLLITEPIAGSENPAVLSMKAEVTCMTIVANRAWVGGVVTWSSNPDFVGGETGWSVMDDGDGPSSEDLIGLITIPSSDPGHAQGICDREIPRFALLPIERGNVRVQFADFVEDFSSFADGEVPTAPSPDYTYLQNDLLAGVSVRVASSSGLLGDRPLVLSKADATTIGAPSFSIRSTRGRLVDVSSGTIRISADIQVDGGAFCSFFTVRAPTSAPASVYLHELSYEVGTPFTVVLELDVEAGTISASQDGTPVPVTVTDPTGVTGLDVPFPYMPGLFGFEGCTTFGQSYSVDNLRLSWDRR